jgi:nucleoside-diphosphate-sugar epimerase
MATVAILGAGGAIGSELVKQLAGRKLRIRLVGRNPKMMSGAAEVVAADLTDRDSTLKAVSGSSVAFLVAGLKYDLKLWRVVWPRIMQNTIEAAKRAKARLVFLDNVYMYGKVNGVMTEDTPFHPSSKKGEVRAQIATMLLNEMKNGSLTALIARAADFYGPNTPTGIPNVLVLDNMAKGKKAMWLMNDSRKHSLSFTLDIARSLVLLANNESAWNQTWHVPTAPNPPTGKEFIRMAADEFHVAPKYRVLNRAMVWGAGWFDSNIREVYEMLYQYEFDYVFDSTKFTRAFGFQPTTYAEGIHITAQSYPRAAQRAA